jgi:putative membrane-bound dehydrogenase-like protein
MAYVRVTSLLILTLLPLADDPPPQFPRTPPTEPAAVGSTFRVQNGFRMELLAAEPLVNDPVAAAYDEDGRLYVVEMSDYPYVHKENDKPFVENTLDPPLGRVKVLTDRDGDGVFDKATVLADKLSWPTGVAVWKGGVFVAATPSLWYLKDADGDGRAEVREKVFEGFRKFNVQAVMNNLQWGLDHKVYGAGSSNGGEIRPGDRPEAKAVPLLRSDFRFDPSQRVFERISGGARFGNTFDDWGNRFLCDIRNPAQHVLLPMQSLARNPYLAAPRVLHDVAEAGDTIPIYRISPPESWREFRARRWAARGRNLLRSELVGAGYLTSSSGVTIYRGDAYPREYRGQLFLGEVANNAIHRETVVPDGVTFRARRADDHIEFVASTDTWFRPVNFVNAPDGTLHVLDMYRETIEHPWSIPDDIKAGLDLRSGADRGRIYRLAPPGFRPRPAPRLSQLATSLLVELFEHPNAWHRETAHRLIFERQDRSVVTQLRVLLREGREPFARLHALWSLEGLNALNDDDLVAALADWAGVCDHAVLLAERRLARSERLRRAVMALATLRAPRIRFQVALTLGEVAGDDPAVVLALAAIARRDADDPWIRTAILSSASRVAVPLLQALDDAGPNVQVLRRSLAETIGAEGNPQRVATLLDHLADHPPPDVDQVLLGLGEGLGRAGRKLAPVSPRARELVAHTLKRAADVAADDRADLERREQAVAILRQTELPEARRVLAPLLDTKQPQRLQLAAVRSLATFPDAEVAPTLLEHWPGAPPALRSEILTRLLARPAWTAALLEAVAKGTVPASAVPPNRRALLLADTDPKLRERARSVLGEASLGSRREVVERYRPALDRPANSTRGERVFERECMACHRLGPRGHAVGPNLASVQRRTADELLLHVLDPNREVSPDSMEYSVALDDGRVLTGLVASESAASLTLLRAEGVEETVLRSQVETLTSTGKSLMPEGFETRITPQEMADLIAFLLVLPQ